MNFEIFAKNVDKSGAHLSLGNVRPQKGLLLDNEALFQLPFISLIILVMAKDKRKPFVRELGQLVGECIQDSMIAYKSSNQHVGWSANLRVRTVKALSFLEQSELVEIDNRHSRVKVTALGKKVINKALATDNDLSYNLSLVAFAYRNKQVSKQLRIQL